MTEIGRVFTKCPCSEPLRSSGGRRNMRSVLEFVAEENSARQNPAKFSWGDGRAWDYPGSPVQLQTNENRRALKQQGGFYGVPLGQRAERIFPAADDAGHAQHALFIGAGEFVLKVSGHHVANFAERVRPLFLATCLVPQHAGGNLAGGLPVAANRQNSAH